MEQQGATHGGGKAQQEASSRGTPNANSDWIGFGLDWIDLMDGWSGLVLLSVAAGGPVAPSQGEAQIQSD